MSGLFLVPLIFALASANLRTTDKSSGKRFYTWRSEDFWSVTTILSMLPKPWLGPWGIKATAEGAVRRREVFASMIRQCRTPDVCSAGEFCIDCLETIKWMKGLPYGIRDRAADIGTSVHEATEAYVLGKPMPPWGPLVKPRIVQFERFLADYAPEYQEGMVEAPVFNRTQKYAGTLDAIATIGKGPRKGWRFVQDAKSGRGIYPEVGVQMAAYRNAEFVGAPDGSEIPMPEVDGAAALHLREDGYDLIEVRADEAMFKVFLYARELYRFEQEIKKTALLGNVPMAHTEGQEALAI